MAKPKIFLFHGNDTRASLAELGRWRGAFAQKYDGAGVAVIEADEGDSAAVRGQISSSLTTHSLFAEPRFTVVRRANSLKPAAQKELVTTLSSALPGMVEGSVLVVWEDALLKDSSSLLKWAKERAEVKEFAVPDARVLVERAIKELGRSITPEARAWLIQWCKQQEKVQRVESRLKATERIAADRRVWELPSLLESAALMVAETRPVEVPQLEQALTLNELPVSPFEIVNAVQAGGWEKAGELAKQFGARDEKGYYGLATLLRMHFERELQGRGKDMAWYGLQLLAEIELASKNVGVQPGWLFDLLFRRCAEYPLHGSRPLLSPRRLWLSHVQRLS
jgi:hypothetical protein